MKIKELLNELFQYKKEREWFEYKENWFQPVTLGEYVSALSNASAPRSRPSPRDDGS